MAAVARIPLRLAKTGEIAPAPELPFESSGKWEKIHALAVGLKHHQMKPLGWCGRAGALQQGWGLMPSSSGPARKCVTCDLDTGAPVSQRAQCCLGLLSGPQILLLSWGLCSVLEASLEQLCVLSLLLSEDICVAGSSYDDSVNINERVSLIMSSLKSHIFLFFNDRFLPFTVSDLKHMFLLLGDSAVIPFLYLIYGGRAWSCALGTVWALNGGQSLYLQEDGQKLGGKRKAWWSYLEGS